MSAGAPAAARPTARPAPGGAVLRADGVADAGMEARGVYALREGDFIA